MKTIAIIGAGAMGAGVAARLTASGFAVCTILDGRSAATRVRAAKAGMAAVAPDELMNATLLLSIVPPSQAERVVDMLAAALCNAKASPLFVDCNALAPHTKRRLSDRVTGLGGRFIDATILGLPPVADEPGPRTLVCGNGAAEVGLLDGHGLTVRVLAGPIGTAAAVKMCYAGINKGLTALTTAVLLAAERAGAADALHAELAHGMPWIVERARRSVPAMYPKAYRWVAEMDEIATFLRDDPVAAAMYADIGRFFADRAMAPEGTELARLQPLLDVTGLDDDR